jgi:hypothetical protein
MAEAWSYLTTHLQLVTRSWMHRTLPPHIHFVIFLSEAMSYNWMNKQKHWLMLVLFLEWTLGTIKTLNCINISTWCNNSVKSWQSHQWLKCHTYFSILHSNYTMFSNNNLFFKVQFQKKCISWQTLQLTKFSVQKNYQVWSVFTPNGKTHTKSNYPLLFSHTGL